jgi:hypothetical protein
MIKTLAAIRRKPGMTQHEYFSYIRDVHGALARAKPLAIRRYVQNHVVDSAYGAEGDPAYQGLFHRDSVTELYFDDVEGMLRSFTDAYVRDVVGPDGANFSDMPTALAMLARDVELDVPAPADAQVKMMYFLRKPDALTPERFAGELRHAVDAALRGTPQAAAAVRRAVLTLAIRDETGLMAYFGAKDMPGYDAVVNLWFDEGGALPAFRAWQKAFLGANVQPAFHLPSQAFVLLVREVDII